MKALKLGISVMMCVLLVACKSSQVQGNGHETTTARNVAVFNHIAINGGYELDVQIGSPQRLQITTDSNVEPLIATDVQDGVLNIQTKAGYSVSHKNPIKVEVFVQDLQGITMSGAAKIHVKGIATNIFTLRANGSVVADFVGKAKDVVITVAGSGKINAKDLQSDRVTVNLNGSGEIQIFAEKELSAKIAGHGKVTYWGKPNKVVQSIAGSGVIIRGS